MLRFLVTTSVGQLPTFAGKTDYHGPYKISLLSSKWDQVEHLQYSRLTLVTTLKY